MDEAYYKNKLEERLAELVAAQEASKEERKPVELDQARFGRLTRMDAMQQQQMAQAAGRMAEIEIQRIHQALKRIEAGNFGICLTCEEEISEKRLNVDPSLPTCIDCASAAEKRRR
jgi:DnaK suppressor protein